MPCLLKTLHCSLNIRLTRNNITTLQTRNYFSYFAQYSTLKFPARLTPPEIRNFSALVLAPNVDITLQLFSTPLKNLLSFLVS